MEYNQMLQKVQELDFVSNKDTADAMIKSVLGHLASRMKEAQARKFTQDLPQPLSLEKLRGHQVNNPTISLDQFVNDLRDQFHITNEQVQSLIKTILHTVKNRCIFRPYIQLGIRSST